MLTSKIKYDLGSHFANSKTPGDFNMPGIDGPMGLAI